jgi:hypothetical protein
MSSLAKWNGCRARSSGGRTHLNSLCRRRATGWAPAS